MCIRDSICDSAQPPAHDMLACERVRMRTQVEELVGQIRGLVRVQLMADKQPESPRPRAQWQYEASEQLSGLDPCRSRRCNI
eukprot:5359270-Pyramimonas_sp.AAC.1